MMDILANEQFFTLAIIPLLIMAARIVDVTLGTIRLIFISKGEKLLSAGIGFFEVLVWLLAITRIMDNLTNAYAYIAYAGGFAIGTYLGITIENRITIGKVMVRFTTTKDAADIVEELRRKRYTFTCVGVDGPDGEVKSLHVIINKKDLKKLINYITKYDEKTFYTVEDVKIVTEHVNYSDSPKTSQRWRLLRKLGISRCK
ncbi:MAG: DUF2179 domain-containing protein [Candidatus Aenigmarchaeota archaeon]|nr:DUF2179 domain-containing protein [Candidatus Aenigmarchaeota archaeon]